MSRGGAQRSCWKPQLKNDEVQHILTLWERKLVEVMHRWTHPELWIAYRMWKRRTWDLERLHFIVSARARAPEPTPLIHCLLSLLDALL